MTPSPQESTVSSRHSVCPLITLPLPLLQALSLAAAASLMVASGCRGPARADSQTLPTTAARRAPAPVQGEARGAVTSQAHQVQNGTAFFVGLGARVSVPPRWWVRRVRRAPGKAWLVVEGPARQLWVALVAVRAKSPEAAIAAAWKRARPGLALKIRKTMRPPASSGWDVVVQTVYVTPTASRRIRLALARGKGGAYYVALLNAKIAALGRRGAQLRTLLGSLKAPGILEESFAGKPARKLDAKRLAALESFVRKARKALGVVGASVAVIQGGRVIYKKGFGLRKMGGKAPVTPRTLFMIGSITKTFTGMVMARLVDEKRFTWETPVTKIYPRFALGDSAVTRRCHMRHTLCACTGLPRQDMEFLFEYKGATALDRIKVLATMRPTTRFGETFQYSNLMVAAGGYVAAHAAFPKLPLGEAYRRALTSRLLRPAGMRHTTLDMRHAARMNHATPHAPTLEDHPAPIPLAYENTVVSVGPAGGAWSNVEDMARFVLLELGRGRTPEGRRLVSARNVERLWKPGARMADHKAYGLAMVVSTKRRIRILGHGGGTLGFSTNMVFLPDHGVGLVSLTNVGGGSGGFNSLVFRRLLELLFDARPRAEAQLDFVVKERARARARAAKRIDRKPPVAWVRRFAGTYANPALGRITVRVKGSRGELDAGEWRAPIARFTAPDGAVRLMIGAPLAGLAFDPGHAAPHTGSGRSSRARRTLTLRTAQQRYVFKEIR